MTADDLRSLYKGQAINVDYENGQPFPANQPYQCWDLVDRYSLDRGWGAVTTGDGYAEGVFNLFEDPLPQYYDRIANTPDNAPACGDIIVWDRNVPGVTGVAGHIALVLSGGPTGFVVLEQNNPQPYVTEASHPYTGVLGWLHPKALNQGDDMPIPDQDNYFNRYNKAMLYIRGREMSRQEFQQNFVGRTDLQMLEAMLDNPEADGAHANEEEGASLAPGELEDLKSWKVMGQDYLKQLNDLKAQTAADIAQFTKQLADTNAKLSDVTKQYQDLLNAPVTGPPAPGTPVTPSLDSYSFGELISAAFAKLFKLK